VAYQLVEMTIAMHEELLAFWSTMPGLYLDEESRDELETYLRRNPGLSYVAIDTGRIIGTVKCGQDGRRGYLHHLAVAPDHRGAGIASDLVARCLAALKEQGIRKCNTYVYDTNEEALEFWKHNGWWELPYDYRTLQHMTG
jgi:ribosomal protein S18 acetylase RimI-like enzyme